MDYTLQQFYEFITSIRMTKRIEDFSMNLYFLKRGLKPSILWDFGKVNVEKLCGLKSLMGPDLLILDVASSDYFICLKSSLLKTLEKCLSNPPLFIDASEALEKPEEAGTDVSNLLIRMVQCVLEQINNQSDNFLSISVDKSWNLSSLFGILLGFPVVYYYDIIGDNCLGNLDLTVWSVGSGQVNPVSFSSPANMEGMMVDRVARWWGDMVGDKEWGADCQIGELNVCSKKTVVNMPVVVL